jgi:hypothetical protein
MVYTVFVDDNFQYMDESKRYELGVFDTYEVAVAACKSVVDQFLAAADCHCTADEMFHHYKGFGEDPWIRGDDPAHRFSAWTYAQQRCSELARPNHSS